MCVLLTQQQAHMGTSPFPRVGSLPRHNSCLCIRGTNPISHSDLCSLDVRAAVVLDALVGRLPGTITGDADAASANDAVSGSAAAGPGF